eukprot:Clim_evm87s11 gene=Clim_evmTU87s11
MSGIMGLFGKSKTPEEKVREWQRKLRQEERQIDRQIRDIQREENKVKQSMKIAAKKGDKTSCRILAKEVVNSRRQVNKLHTTKAQMHSVSMQMQNQLSMAKMAGQLQKSTDVMKAMNKLVKLPAISKQMQEMQKEMMKAGIIEEMLDETLQFDDEDIEEAADEEVEAVMRELTEGILSAGGEVSKVNPEPEEEEEEEEEDMKARLEALKA